MTRPKVAIQLISTGGMYGAERVLLELAVYLMHQGWQSHVVALEGSGAAPLVARSTELGLCAHSFAANGRVALLPMMVRLKRLLDRYPSAVVHSHGYKPDILLSGLGIQRRVSCMATCHNWISESWKQRSIEIIDRRALRRLGHVIAVSNDILQRLIRSGIPREKVSLIDNGIEMPEVDGDARERIRQEFRVARDAKLVVQIGRLAWSKRNDLLLHAVHRLVPAFDVNVLLIGEGDQREAIVQLSEQLEIADRVRLCGYRKDIGNLLAAADVLTVTSDIEAMPIVVLEAMAVGCPIVATEVGEIPSLLTDGRDGLIVPPGEAGVISEAIRSVITQPYSAKERAARAHEAFKKRFSREIMGNRYLEIYDRSWSGHLA